MSEYQYYEFLAIDKPLSEAQMGELRAISTRARITPTSFTNTYSYGDFGGDPSELVDQYFDLFLYLANWGTHQLALRLPRRLLDLQLIELYAESDLFQVRAVGDHLVLEFSNGEEEDGGGWVADEEGHNWVTALTPVRSELAAGDHRVLYLGWLIAVQNEYLAEQAVEPPVPPGLGQLSPALEAFAEFFYLDPDLIDEAAEASPPLTSRESEASALPAWIAGLPEAEKTEILTRFVLEGEATLRAELLQRFRQGQAGDAPAVGHRTAGKLRAAAQARAAEREEAEARAAEAERQRQAKEAALAREQHLKSLVGREARLWTEVQTLVATKSRRNYDEAVELLTDLRDLADCADAVSEFKDRLRQLRIEHARKITFIERIARAGL